MLFYFISAGNQIGEAGMKGLLLAIQYQQTLSTLSPHPALKGLMRLSIAVSSFLDIQ